MIGTDLCYGRFVNKDFGHGGAVVDAEHGRETVLLRRALWDGGEDDALENERLWNGANVLA